MKTTIYLHYVSRYGLISIVTPVKLVIAVDNEMAGGPTRAKHKAGEARMLGLRSRNFISVLLAGGATLSLTSGAASAQVKDAPETASGTPADVSEIVVTGSRIRSNGYDQPTPVSLFTTQALNKAVPTTLADGLVQLPQFNGSTSRTFCCAVGALGNFLNLRGLGPLRTLVLLDSRRIVATSEAGRVDINLLPELLVQQVEIVTGGASAVYGSDAVSGVVNFVVDKKFEGVKAIASTGVSTYGDDAFYKLGVAGGISFAGGKGHIVASLEHFNQDGIPSLNARPTSSLGGFLGGNGSATAPFTNLVGINQITATEGGVIVNAAGAPVRTAGAPLAGQRFLPGGATTPFVLGVPVVGSPAFTVGGDGFRNNAMQPAGSLRTDKGFLYVSYDLSENVTGYIRGNAAESQNRMRILSDNRSAAASYTIFRSNAFLPTDIAAQMDAAGTTSFRLGRFNRDFGTINLDYKNKTYDVGLGFNGSFGNGFTWNASYGHGETTLNAEVQNVADLGKSYAAVDAVVNPATGQIVCNVTLTNPGSFAGCQPLNPFGVGAPSAAAKAFILGTSTQYVQNTQNVFDAGLQGNIAQLPGGELRFAVGAEYRTRSLLEKSNPTALGQIQATGVRGMPGAFCPTPTTCRFGGWNQGNFGEAKADDNVKEAYVEVLAPLFRDSKLGNFLEINAAYRYTDYENSGPVSTWKLGLIYEPVADLRLRVTRSRDIRAPNLFELFAGPVNAFTPGLTDPVTGLTNVIAITRTQGNPGLEPEVANTWTAGLVYAPTWAAGFSGSIDYYNIDLAGALAATTAQGTIDSCQAGVAAKCALITRDPVTKTISQIVLQQVNLSGRQTSGIDFDLSYVNTLGGGKLAVRLVATRLIDYTDTIGGIAVQSAGFYNANGDIGVALPKWRGNLTASYDLGQFNYFIQQRYIGGYLQLPFIPGQVFADPSVSAVWYTDATITATINTGTSKLQIFGTVTNLFNQQAPFLPNRFAANLGYPTVPNMYDFGRNFSVGVRMGF